MNGLVALVTGGASGLGLACINRFLKQGISHVHFCDLPTSKGEEIAKSMDSSLVTYHPVDVTNDNEVEQMFNKIQEKNSKLNCLVQCAGIGVAFRCYNINKRSMHSMEEFNRVMNVNVVGTFNVLRRTCHVMADNQPDARGQRGVIINTSSIAAYEGQIGQVAYSATSGALASMTLPLARDLASVGIRVCTILPGVFDQTKMVEPLSDKSKSLLAMMVTFPSQLGLPDDFARLTQNIIENNYLNGENIRLDGAMRMPP
ncbi:unnamed protein product [Adineta steineri]|uniref:Ketoreductase domain-containing protein n=1 Tax=Adineta steineri TaxID=433720 RepID=A0A818V012_9BILA|nr:unnamed protein product [Adineta steineri]CAF0967328.1 unnamed protein product [Adineta steineri]CAF1061651.1 unnamed protein product [Adineta steineri]CAF3580860.1 unnamed protein product [Adineta steineri]CAF3642059.1 unnamed protein product [Adineta steineri]